MKSKNIYTNIWKEENLNPAIQLLKNSGLSILDCARLIKNALDFKPKKSKLNNVQYCFKIINSGIKHLHIKDMSIESGFKEYLKTKTSLRKSSFDDIKYLGKRLLRNANFAKMNFSELTISDCEKYLSKTYPTPSQFNKAHTMLNGLFNYALHQEWAQRNVVKLVPKRKVIETEIKALTLAETKALIKTSQLPKYQDCQAAVALQIWAGIRPQEIQGLKWQDIDLEENIIRITPTTSKTGGTRHIEICKPLKACLKACLAKLSVDSAQWAVDSEIDKIKDFKDLKNISKAKTRVSNTSSKHIANSSNDELLKKTKLNAKPCDTKTSSTLAVNYTLSTANSHIVARNWKAKWKSLRQDAGFITWTQDVLRHTYASYHAKHYKDLPRLQINMGHNDLSLLRTRYINLYNISKLDAKSYFSIRQ